HMGTHILRSMHGVYEVLITPIGNSFPCGFCGSSGNADCAVKLKMTAQTKQLETKCAHQDSFKYGNVDKGSENCPCRNIPIICTLCTHLGRETDW
ncbi:hypothetical protein BDR05DRAFT_892041, partial [Suillus weaverae]